MHQRALNQAGWYQTLGSSRQREVAGKKSIPACCNHHLVPLAPRERFGRTDAVGLVSEAGGLDGPPALCYGGAMTTKESKMTLGDKIRDLDSHGTLDLADEADALQKSRDNWREGSHRRDDLISLLEVEIDNLKTTLAEDLAYQEKLEAQIGRLTALANEYALQGDDVYSEDILAALEGDA